MGVFIKKAIFIIGHTYCQRFLIEKEVIFDGQSGWSIAA